MIDFKLLSENDILNKAPIDSHFNRTFEENKLKFQNLVINQNNKI